MRGPGVAASVLSAAALAVVAGGCGSVAADQEVGNASQGKQLFVQNCGSCHTLADAGTRGNVGPNLDEAFDDVRRGDDTFSESTIRDVVRGQIAYPVETTVTGAPGMPANLVTGEDAASVATYVASVAGLPVQGGGGKVTATSGEEIYAAAGCGSCHVLAAAGSTGTIGPNLDEAKPSKELAIERVTNGKPPMPPFKDQLTPEQIEAVAEFVASSARK